ncbi:Ribosomal RNA small subunit methyltransferase A [Galdieria sulphuraria]|uniref:rRNA adenine N(6)-methyltransferase n=1 Tax=Galdieria sulphuraria TaxID=130081 RepID=M2Y419_GALSU|nr:dimethyladenosine transferase [Galdieria sulphuraria]EME30703.1 dimethyladenosine transferase [Galdieria sulphuraria]GJD10777.1 Ribosomal RNA small subunit methyltransferase A [Galdieria sulphuraria]|eukprot:XP_005707223.1 dimethyladenosine transferase [Galdieria sulphuraria]
MPSCYNALPAFGMVIHFKLLRRTTSFVNPNKKLGIHWVVKIQNKTLHITSCQQSRPDRNRSLLAKQSLGQNFLYDDNYIHRICNQVDFDVENGGKRVVEVGPGLGALTRVLHEKYPNMTTIEIDTRAVDHLHSKFPQLKVLHQDVLCTDWKALAQSLGGPLAVIGNLPYNITTPILFSLIKNSCHVDHAILTMQLEVARRITAKPRSKDFGVLSVFSQLHSRPSLLFHLPPSVFRPIPQVTSALVRLDFKPKRATELLKYVSMEELTQVVRTAFQQRRKRMSNSLKSLTNRLQKELPEDLKGRRAEELKPEDFVQLTEYLFGRRAEISE